MNEALSRMKKLAPTEVARRLRREGIACASEGVRLDNRTHERMEMLKDAEPFVRHFNVTVFDLEVTDVQRVFPGRRGVGYGGIRAEPDDRLRRIVARAAVRAVYVLGLEFGQVLVATDERGKPAIVQLSTQLEKQDGEGAWRMRAAMELRASLLGIESADGVRAMLGADPEFVLLSLKGRVVPASRFLPPGGLAGCDSVVRRGIRAWPLVELRPDPAVDPEEVVASLRRLLRLAARRIDRAGAEASSLRWCAGAMPVQGLPLGGHVHISGAALTSERLRALDNAVALPLRLLEPAGAARRRPGYGALGDFRRQPHGGFEYRTPPSWLVSPQLALGVLSLAKIAAEHAGELAGCRPLDEDALREFFYAENNGTDEWADPGNETLREAALAFYEKIRKLNDYRRYEASVDYIFDAVQARRHWDESADLRRRWGIPVK